MRVYLRRSPPEFRGPRGGHVIDLQRSLQQAGHSPNTIDGDFGQRTEMAVKSWQLSRGWAPSGEVDGLTWEGVVKSSPPSLFRRCLALTAAFEGHGYTLVAGNFDGAYLTWGIIGFTLRGGNLGKVIARIDDRHPGLIVEAMGQVEAAELLQIIQASKTAQRVFADSISMPPKKYRVRADWRDAFLALGNRPEVRAIQDEVAREVYWRRAIQDYTKFGLDEELDLALMFDTAVQNGGINAAKEARIRNDVAASPGARGQARREIMAHGIAETSKPEWVEDVRSRKLMIASGTGTVHGAKYRLVDWGLAALPVAATDLV